MTDKTRELFEAWHIEEFGHKPDHLYAAEMYAAFAHQQAIIDRLERALRDIARGKFIGPYNFEAYAVEIAKQALSHTTTKEQGNG